MIARRSILGALPGAPVLPGRAAVDPAAPMEFRGGDQKGGILSLVRQQGRIEAKLKGRGVESVKWVEFHYGPQGRILDRLFNDHGAGI